MKISTPVHVSKTLEHLKTPISNFSFEKKLQSIFHKLVKVAFHVFKHKVQNIIFPKDFLEFHNVWVVHLSQ